MNERRMAQSHLMTLSAGDVMVYDRGYFTYAMLYVHQQRGVAVIFRLARCSGKAIDFFMDSDETDTIATIESEWAFFLSECHCALEAQRSIGPGGDW